MIFKAFFLSYISTSSYHFPSSNFLLVLMHLTFFDFHYHCLKYFLVSLQISSLTHRLFRSILLNFQIFGILLCVSLLSISNLILLWPETILFKISVFWNLLLLFVFIPYFISKYFVFLMMQYVFFLGECSFCTWKRMLKKRKMMYSAVVGCRDLEISSKLRFLNSYSYFLHTHGFLCLVLSIAENNKISN